MWYAAKNHWLASIVLQISSIIQGVEMLSLGSFNTGAIVLAVMYDIFWVVFTSIMAVAKSFDAPIKVLFSIADDAPPLYMLTLGDILVPGIFVARAMRIAVPSGNMNCYFNCAFLQYTVGFIVMNWFQATQAAHMMLAYIACGVIGFVTIYYLWNGEVKKKDGTNQLVGKLWDWKELYEAKLKTLDGLRVLQTVHDNGSGSDSLEHCVGGHEDCDNGVVDATTPSEDRDGSQNDCGVTLDDSDDDSVCGESVVQILAVRANFPIAAINGYDLQLGRSIYRQLKGQVQEDGMVDLVLTGPRSLLMALGYFTVEVFPSDTAVFEAGSRSWPRSSRIIKDFDVYEADELREHTQTICGGPGRKVEITYLVIPNAIETKVAVRLKLKDPDSRSCSVYGKISVRAADYGNRSVHLFSRERGRSWPVSSDSTSDLPLSPAVVAVPYHRQLELQIEVDLTVVTTSDNQEEDKNFKFTNLKFNREIRSQEREVDDDKVEVSITWYPEI